ncbi:hypothetical protein BBSC_0809 [Bifidobacterium scardovii JCM 12489 = DSM 13734]|nr:hypothetical protein BBSC_0809 [Bifidobacterium scardovii JCM 12489 = DSM 13734]
MVRFVIRFVVCFRPDAGRSDIPDAQSITAARAGRGRAAIGCFCACKWTIARAGGGSLGAGDAAGRGFAGVALSCRHVS